MRNGRPIGGCGAASPETEDTDVGLALFVRLRHLVVSVTGERAPDACQAKIPEAKDHRAQAFAADREDLGAEIRCREEDARTEEESRAEGRKAEASAGIESARQEISGSATSRGRRSEPRRIAAR